MAIALVSSTDGYLKVNGAPSPKVALRPIWDVAAQTLDLHYDLGGGRSTTLTGIQPYGAYTLDGVACASFAALVAFADTAFFLASSGGGGGGGSMRGKALFYDDSAVPPAVGAALDGDFIYDDNDSSFYQVAGGVPVYKGELLNGQSAGSIRATVAKEINRWRNSKMPAGILLTSNPGILEHGFTTLADGRLYFSFGNGDLYGVITKDPFYMGLSPLLDYSDNFVVEAASSQQYQYTKAVYWPASGKVHQFAHSGADQGTYEKSATTPQTLVGQTFVKIADGISDFCAVVRPDGGLLGVGHRGGKTVIFTRENPAAAWVEVKYLYAQQNGVSAGPGYGTLQADVCPYYEGTQLYILIHGLPEGHFGTPYRRFILLQPVDSNYNPIGRAVNVIRMEEVPALNISGAVNAGNPTRIKNAVFDGYSLSVFFGIGLGELNADTSGPATYPDAVFSIESGKSYELCSNVALRSYGTVSGTVANGFRATASDGGFYGYSCDTGYLAAYRITIRIKPIAFPVDNYAILMSVNSDNYGNHLQLSMDDSGNMYWWLVKDDGVVYYLKAGVATVDNMFETALYYNGTNFFVNDKPAYNVGAAALLPAIAGIGFREAVIITWCNDGTDAVAPAHWFNGEVHKILFEKL